MIRHAASLVALRRAVAFLTLVILSCVFVAARGAASPAATVPSVPSWVDRTSVAPDLPDPPPAWHELTPKTTERRLTLVSEVAGHFWRWRGEPVYVWDLAAVRHPDGNIVILRAALQHLDGRLDPIRTELDDHPPGSVEILTLDEYFANAGPTIWWSDVTGEVFTMSVAAAGPGDVEPGGLVRVDPLSRCLLRGNIICVPSDECVGLTCTEIGNGCKCEGGTCQLLVLGGCEGRCSPGKACHWEPILRGCSCQD